MDPVTPARGGARASFPIRRRRPKKNVLCNVDPSVSGRLARRSLAPESTKPLHSSISPAQSQPVPSAETPVKILPIPEKAATPRKSSATPDATTATAFATATATANAAQPSANPVSVDKVSSESPSKQTSPAPSPKESRRAHTPPKRKKMSSKAYASIPADVSQEERFRILVEKFLQAKHAAAVLERPQRAKEAMDAMETAVLDGIEAAGEPERSPDSEKISALTRPDPDEPNLRQRAEKLDYVVAQYRDELQQWESLEADLPTLAAKAANGGSPQPEILGNSPPLPCMSSLLEAGESEARPPLVDAVESFILHNDDANCSLKRLEAQHEQAAVVLSAITKTITASVFDGGLPGLNT